MTALVTSVADAVGAAAHASAATAAACGAAIDVPLSSAHVSKPKPSVICDAGEFLSVLPSACEMKTDGRKAGTSLADLKLSKDASLTTSSFLTESMSPGAPA